MKDNDTTITNYKGGTATCYGLAKIDSMSTGTHKWTFKIIMSMNSVSFGIADTIYDYYDKFDYNIYTYSHQSPQKRESKYYGEIRQIGCKSNIT